MPSEAVLQVAGGWPTLATREFPIPQLPPIEAITDASVLICDWSVHDAANRSGLLSRMAPQGEVRSPLRALRVAKRLSQHLAGSGKENLYRRKKKANTANAIHHVQFVRND